ncbi:hypothetical protein NDU88_006923 [Pleurodeles waltl]|uniref:Uncharacterized protein n=1 Tax=Pleurodeles waltl TaxID=8319 RepID=A0AAV7QLF3_PLEWA|nr:hypothetical protein NDU88_006923 [Pleurodeles waltl]
MTNLETFDQVTMTADVTDGTIYSVPPQETPTPPLTMATPFARTASGYFVDNNDGLWDSFASSTTDLSGPRQTEWMLFSTGSGGGLVSRVLHPVQERRSGCCSPLVLEGDWCPECLILCRTDRVDAVLHWFWRGTGAQSASSCAGQTGLMLFSTGSGKGLVTRVQHTPRDGPSCVTGPGANGLAVLSMAVFAQFSGPWPVQRCLSCQCQTCSAVLSMAVFALFSGHCQGSPSLPSRAVAGGPSWVSWAMACGALLATWAVAGGGLLGSDDEAGSGFLGSDDGAGSGLLGSDDGAGGGLLGSDSGGGLLGSDDGAGVASWAVTMGLAEASWAVTPVVASWAVTLAVAYWAVTMRLAVASWAVTMRLAVASWAETMGLAVASWAVTMGLAVASWAVMMGLAEASCPAGLIAVFSAVLLLPDFGDFTCPFPTLGGVTAESALPPGPLCAALMAGGFPLSRRALYNF